MTTQPRGALEAAQAVADEIELLSQGLNDAFVAQRWTDSQKIAEKLLAISSKVRTMRLTFAGNTIRNLIMQMRSEKYMTREERDCTNYIDLHEEWAGELESAMLSAGSEGDGAEVLAPGSRAWMAEVCDTAARNIEATGKPHCVSHLRQIGAWIRSSRPAPSAEDGQTPASAAGERTGTVADIPDDKLLERCVRHAVRYRGRQVAWAAISKVTALGSTYSIQLCRRFGLDPDTGKPIAAQGGSDGSASVD